MAKPLPVLPDILEWFQCGLVKLHVTNMRNLGSSLYSALIDSSKYNYFYSLLQAAYTLPKYMYIYIGSKWDSGNSRRLNISGAIKLNCVDAIWFRNASYSRLEVPPRH